MGIEFELKYAATPEALAAVRQELGGQWQEYAMQTTYYDTSDGALSLRKWTLRRRLENGVSVCTLKTPAENARREFEVCRDTIEDAIEELCKLSGSRELAQLAQGGLVAVCGAAFTRLASTVSLPEGAVEVALDTGRLFGGSRQEPLCELEVELKSGPREAAILFAAQLAARYGLQTEPRSKFKRALALTR